MLGNMKDKKNKITKEIKARTKGNEVKALGRELGLDIGSRYQKQELCYGHYVRLADTDCMNKRFQSMNE